MKKILDILLWFMIASLWSLVIWYAFYIGNPIKKTYYKIMRVDKKPNLFKF